MAPQMTFVPRAVWGSSNATELYIAKRVTDPAASKTSIQIHHTAGADDDATPSRWGYDDAVRYMRRLQTLRPELGPLPYSENPAVSEDLKTVWLFEGRGILKRGAHTAGHNVDGVGFGVLGNFDRGDSEAAETVSKAIEARCRLLREDDLPNLGMLRSPTGSQAWGHRDSKATTCPGSYLYRTLQYFDMEGPPMAGWQWNNGAGAPIEDLEDADAVFAFQGSFFQGDDVATYLANVGNPSAGELEARTGQLIGEARITEEIMKIRHTMRRHGIV